MPDKVKSKVYSVTELDNNISAALSKSGECNNILLKGEISACKVYGGKGHLYFTLKDEKSVISAAMWGFNARYLSFNPQVGDKVVCSGSVQLYNPNGKLSFIAEGMEKEDSEGELAKAKQALFEKLNKEGIFSAEHKKPIPPFPKKIAVVTAPGGAALQDIIRTVANRCPAVSLVVVPAVVQGEDAPHSIAQAMRKAQETNADVIIVGRGGGASEDLSAFNSEEVVRAVYESKIPTISAVGHETDTSFSDLAADDREATPTAAATRAVPDLKQMRAKILDLENSVSNGITKLIRQKQLELDVAMRNVRMYSPKAKLSEKEQHLVMLEDKINSAVHVKLDMCEKALNNRLLITKSCSPTSKIREKENRLDLYEKQAGEFIRNKLTGAEKALASRCDVISALNPMSILGRGYSATEKEGRILMSTKELFPGDTVETKLGQGSFTSVVKEIKE